MGQRIGVGIVGASPGRSWAAAAHLPALAHLDSYAVTAVATTNPASAQAAATAFGATHAYTDAAELAADPAVDLVVVSVKAPAHAAAIRAALAAGKHVYSEWPLGVDLAEAGELAAAADRAGVVHAVGLQGYHSPSVRFVRETLASGRIGTVESVSMVTGGDPLGGTRIPASLAWGTDRTAANTVLTIMAGHAFSVLSHAVDALPVELSAEVATPHGTVTVGETGAEIANDAPSHVAVVGRLAGGAVVSLSVHGGKAPAPDGFLVRIAGTEGTLTATPVDPHHYPGWAEWRVRVADTELPAPPAEPVGIPAANVASLYREMAAAITEGRPAHPSFHTAVAHHRVLDAIERAAATGTRERV